VVVAPGPLADQVGLHRHQWGPVRRPHSRFSRFVKAAQENAASRVSAGVHFRIATTNGRHLGRPSSRFTVRHALHPITE